MPTKSSRISYALFWESFGGEILLQQHNFLADTHVPVALFISVMPKFVFG